MKSVFRFSLVVFWAWCAAALNFAQPGNYQLAAASFLGDASSVDRVRGARILSDGSIVVAANIGAATPGNVASVLLNGATAASGGAIVKLTADGRTVISVTRLAAQIEDVAIDANDNIYVAAWNGGALKINAAANAVLWAKPVGRVLRIDAGANGVAAALVTPATDPDAGNPGAGTIYVIAADGTQTGSFAGKNNTLDVCVDANSSTVVSTGWRQANAFDGSSTQPVQIAYLRGASYAGAVKYNVYDWSTDQTSPDFINRSENNMADTRGYRCAVGADGKLYAAFEVAGGNHIFRYSPQSIVTPNAIVGGDRWHEFYNTASEHKTFFARYEAATGAYLAGQQLLCRLEANDRGNTLRVNRGTIAADAQGRVYIGGDSAYGMPMPPHTRFVVRPNETTFNPFPAGYLGGAWAMVLSADFRTRLYVTRLATNGGLHAFDARADANGAAHFVFGGTTKSLQAETYTTNAVQAAVGGGTQDGFFAVGGAIPTGAPAAFPVQPILECVERTGANAYTARFGYQNDNSAPVQINVGAANEFTTGAPNRGQTTAFQAGRINAAFTVPFDGKRLSWTLQSPNNSRRTVTATRHSPRCR